MIDPGFQRAEEGTEFNSGSFDNGGAELEMLKVREVIILATGRGGTGTNGCH
jgi:hypothetical protein